MKQADAYSFPGEDRHRRGTRNCRWCEVVDGVKLFRGAGRASRRERQQIADPE